MRLLDRYDGVSARLRAIGPYFWPLGLRLILFWEFWEAGSKKLSGRNWFGEIPWAGWQKGFPWPFDLLPEQLNWTLATWAELVFALTLLLGLLTRLSAISLIVITMVATAAVHWPAEWDSLSGLWQGYVITAREAGNFKLPLLFLIMLLPLVFEGAGPISLDRLLLRFTRRQQSAATGADALGLALAVATLGLAAVWVEPIWGAALFAAAAAAAIGFRVAG